MWAKYPGTKLIGTTFKEGKWKIPRCMLTVFINPWIRSFDVVVLLMTAKKCTKTYKARSERLLLSIKGIVLLRSHWRRRRPRCSLLVKFPGATRKIQKIKMKNRMGITRNVVAYATVMHLITINCYWYQTTLILVKANLIAIYNL